MSAGDQVVDSWVEVTGCGTRYEDLTADGQVHVDYAPPLAEPYFEGDDDPDYNPICSCPRVPKAVLPGVRRLRRLRTVHRSARLAAPPKLTTDAAPSPALP